jgi:hypothetical protein
MSIWPFNWKKGFHYSLPHSPWFYHSTVKRVSTIYIVSPSCINFNQNSFFSEPCRGINAVSMSITISNSIQTAKGRERDKVKKKIIRMEKRTQKRCCFLHSLSVWITNNNRGVTSFRVKIKRRKAMGRDISSVVFRFFFIIILHCTSNTYILSRFMTDYFSINWFALEKAVVLRA